LGRDKFEGLMLDVEFLVEVNGLRHQICVKLVQTVVKKSCEVFGQIIGFLKTGAQAVSECSDIRDVLVLADVFFVADGGLEFSVLVKQPLEDGLLDFLIIFLFKEGVLKELH